MDGTNKIRLKVKGHQQQMESTLVAWRRGGGIAAAAATDARLVMLELHHDARDVIAAPAGERGLCQLPGCCLGFLLHLHK